MRPGMAAHMQAVEEAEASGSTGDRGAWKWKIRQRLGPQRSQVMTSRCQSGKLHAMPCHTRIWDYMEENDIAANPRPVHHRIPNFVQSELTAKQVCGPKGVGDKLWVWDGLEFVPHIFFLRASSELSLLSFKQHKTRCLKASVVLQGLW